MSRTLTTHNLDDTVNETLGATLTLEPSVNGTITPDLFVRMQAVTDRLIAERGAYWTQQFVNRDQADGYHSLAEEAWEQSGGRIDAFVHFVRRTRLTRRPL